MANAPIPAALLLSSSVSLGHLVRAQRKSQGLRIDDAASLLGVSVDLMSRLENGKGSVRLDKVLTVLDGLGLQALLVPKGHPWVKQASAGSSREPGQS